MIPLKLTMLLAHRKQTHGQTTGCIVAANMCLTERTPGVGNHVCYVTVTLPLQLFKGENFPYSCVVQICRPFLVSLYDDDVNGSSSLGEVHKSANYVGSCTQRSSRMDWMGPLGQGETIGDCTREREREIGGQK